MMMMMMMMMMVQPVALVGMYEFLQTDCLSREKGAMIIVKGC